MPSAPPLVLLALTVSTQQLVRALRPSIESAHPCTMPPKTSNRAHRTLHMETSSQPLVENLHAPRAPRAYTRPLEHCEKHAQRYETKCLLLIIAGSSYRCALYSPLLEVERHTKEKSLCSSASAASPGPFWNPFFLPIIHCVVKPQFSP